MAKELNMTPEQVLNLSAREFCTIHVYLSHESKCKSEYSRLIMNKK